MTAPAQRNSTHSTLFPDLSPDQARVAEALAEGATITAAAEAAGLHRSTIHNWFRECKPFRNAVEDARDDAMENMREEMKELYKLALKTLKNLIQDPKASPSVRLRAALAIVTRKGWAIAADVKRALDLDINSQFATLERGVPHPLYGTINRPIRGAASGH